MVALFEEEREDDRPNHRAAFRGEQSDSNRPRRAVVASDLNGASIARGHSSDSCHELRFPVRPLGFLAGGRRRRRLCRLCRAVINQAARCWSPASLSSAAAVAAPPRRFVDSSAARQNVDANYGTRSFVLARHFFL